MPGRGGKLGPFGIKIPGRGLEWIRTAGAGLRPGRQRGDVAAGPGDPDVQGGAGEGFGGHQDDPDTLPMFRAMDAALAREAGDHGH